MERKGCLGDRQTETYQARVAHPAAVILFSKDYFPLGLHFKRARLDMSRCRLYIVGQPGSDFCLEGIVFPKHSPR